jgi:RimJ/RimL family protein N-acetyltransferase
MFAARSFKKLRRNYQDYGLGVTLGKTVQGLLAIVYESRTYRIYRIRLDRFTPDPEDICDLELRLLDPAQDDLIDQVEQMEEWLLGKVRHELRTGSICLVALDDGKVAGFNLVSFGKVTMPLVKMTRVFRDNEAWSEQITVGRDYRGRGLAAILRLNVFRILKERGIKRFYGGTLPLNIANRKLSKKVGFQEIADINYRRFLNRRSWAFKRVSKDDQTV